MDKRSSPEKAAFLRYRPDLLVAALTSFSWEWDPKCPAGRVRGAYRFPPFHPSPLHPSLLTGATCSSRFKTCSRLTYGAQ